MSKTTKKVRKSFVWDDRIEAKLSRHARHERKTQTQVLRECIEKLHTKKESNEN